MPIRLIQRPPGQRKIARYRRTQSCIRVAGVAAEKERREQTVRCRAMAILFLVMVIFGVIAVLR